MPRPKGSKNKPKPFVVPPVEPHRVEPQGESNVQKEEKKEKVRVRPTPDSVRKQEEKARNTVRSQKLDPLGPGQQYFEAPDGTMLIGEKTSTKMMYRYRDGDKWRSMWILPKR